MLHRRLASDGGLAGGVRCSNDSDAIDWRILDSPVRDPGTTGVRDLSGECTTHQEPAGAEERCTRESMAAEVAHLRIAQQLVPAHRRNPCGAELKSCSSPSSVDLRV